MSANSMSPCLRFGSLMVNMRNGKSRIGLVNCASAAVTQVMLAETDITLEIRLNQCVLLRLHCSWPNVTGSDSSHLRKIGRAHV